MLTHHEQLDGSGFPLKVPAPEYPPGWLDPELLMIFTDHISHNRIQHEVLLSNDKTGQVVMNNKYNISRPLVKLENSQLIDSAKHLNLYIADILL